MRARVSMRYSWLIIPMMLLCGCRTETPDSKSGTTPVGKDGGYWIAGVGFQNDQFFKLIEMGMKEAEKENNIRLSTGNSAGALDKEIALIDTYITQKMDAIVIAPFNQESSIPALRRAHDRGIKIITYDSFINADFPVSNIKSDQVALGRATGEEAARYLREKRNGKANVAIISYMALLPETASRRNQGFEEEMKKLPGVKIVARQDAWMAEKAVNVVESLLTAHPEIDLVWAANEGGTVGAVTAVRNAGKAGKIVVFGTDISEQMADFLLADDGVLQAVTGQKPFEIGKQAVETAVRALKGETVKKQVDLPGMLFTRRLPEDVRKYRDYLGGLSK